MKQCELCTINRKCPDCQRSHDVPGIGFNIDGEEWHVHTCPWCGIDFDAYKRSEKQGILF